MKYQQIYFAKFLVVLLVSLLLGACGKVNLYSGLNEQEANQMVAILLNNGIAASTERDGDGNLTLMIDKSSIALAVNVLSVNGFPREKRETLGEVFKKSGIISSPFEEHIRFIYALSEEVSATLSQFDGVISARVHVVLPEEAGFNQKIKPSSAAVFIKHRANIDLDFFTPQIKRLVSSAIEGVSYEDVTVVMMEAQTQSQKMLNKPPMQMETFLGLEINGKDRSLALIYLSSITGAFCVLLLICLGLGFWCLKLKSNSKDFKNVKPKQKQTVAQ